MYFYKIKYYEWILKQVQDDTRKNCITHQKQTLNVKGEKCQNQIYYLNS